MRAEGVSRLGDKSSRFVVGLSKWICGSPPNIPPESPSSRTGLLPSSPLRTVHESFPSHSSSPSNASFGETRFRDRNALTVNPVMALWMK